MEAVQVPAYCKLQMYKYGTHIYFIITHFLNIALKDIQKNS